MTSVFDHRPAWADVAPRAFWDRVVAEAEWREGFLAGSPAYLPPTLHALEPREAIPLLGLPAFVEAWPRLRKTALATGAAPARRVRKWDVYWSLAATGTLDVAPLDTWMSLPRRAKEFLRHVSAHPGTSIYAAAKSLGMAYRRAHDHAHRLIALGFLKGHPDASGPRRQVRLQALPAPLTVSPGSAAEAPSSPWAA